MYIDLNLIRSETNLVVRINFDKKESKKYKFINKEKKYF